MDSRIVMKIFRAVDVIESATAIMVFIGVYMKWIRPIVDKIFNIDAPPSYLDSPEEQKRKSKRW